MFSLDVSLESLVSVCILLDDLVHSLVKVPIYAIYTLMILLSMCHSLAYLLLDLGLYVFHGFVLSLCVYPIG